MHATQGQCSELEGVRKKRWDVIPAYGLKDNGTNLGML